MIVYSYFNPVPEMDVDNEHKLIVLWQQSWRRFGFDPVVLTHLHAEAHPQWKEYDELVSSFPSVNPRAYELACWHRWLAFANVGGGLIVDYDVMANAFDTEQLMQAVEDINVLDAGGVPCAVYSVGDGPQKIVEAVLGRKHAFGEVNGHPHYSDMYFFQMMGYPKLPLVAPFGAPGWRNAPLIHFSHGDCGRERPGVDRAFVIKKETK
jgi:hypothetical protein